MARNKREYEKIKKFKQEVIDKVRRGEGPPKTGTKEHTCLKYCKRSDLAFKKELQVLDLLHFPKERGYTGWTEEKLLALGRTWTKSRTALHVEYIGAYDAMYKGKGLDYYLPSKKKVSSRTVYWKEGKIFFKYVTRASFYLDIPCKSIHAVLRGKKKKTEHGHTFRRPTEKELIKIKNGKIKVL